MRGEREHPIGCQRLPRGREVRVNGHRGQIVVIQPGSAQFRFGQIEPERLDQMQFAAGPGNQTYGVAGVLRNPGFMKHQSKHRFTLPCAADGRGRGKLAPVTATRLDGKITRDEMFVDLTARVSALREKGIVPGLGTVLVGDDPGSAAYVRGKHNDCAKVGIHSIRKDLPADVTSDELDAVIDELNADPACTGYIVQLPLPKHLDENRALERVDPAKDADGLHPVNLGRLVLGKESTLPCTPRGIVHLLRRYDVPIAGAHVVVVGRGVTVGRPMGLILTRRSENATVTLCHTGTRDLAAEVRRADIVIAGAGVPNLITADMVKPGAAVVDVGVSRTDDGLRGDIAADVAEVAGFLSPNPGGVGPLTRAFLLSNVVESAERATATSGR